MCGDVLSNSALQTRLHTHVELFNYPVNHLRTFQVKKIICNQLELIINLIMIQN